ncbi:conjugative transposon protein TraJ [Olivibacter domesticus]|uniref:Bacteroides conjugative transposon TraJ protein n=1 Tax=Olivibacter domesticus TaxID=407022 RepID=A0A1H7I8M5_OLID1|nr:conjugative transposon protein TraJ [Olivibacter domesticus]SEK58846.1 Bacteroides conjugative transposon TraJ protein [Olivibacter domesticus]
MCKWKVLIVGISGILLPMIVLADVADKIHSLHGVLDTLKDEMVPMCAELTDIGRAIGGLGALFYIGARVWKHIANAEPVDFYPLFRPFCLGFCIAFFPLVIGTIDAILKPTVTGTAAMVDNSNQAIKMLLKEKEEAILKSDAWLMYVGENDLGDRDRWLRYTKGIKNTDPLPKENIFDVFKNDVKFSFAKASYNFRNTVKEWLSEILQILFQAASLTINTIRIFQLVVLAILGPIVFALAIFDGLQQTLSTWLSKYINIYLWLPVCNIFGAIIGKIQVKMLALDLDQIDNTGDTFFSALDTGYLVFMIIGIVGYFTVPTVASFVVSTMGGGMMQKVTSTVMTMGSMAGGLASGGASLVAKGAGAVANLDNYTGGGGGDAAAFKMAGEAKNNAAGGQGVNAMAGKLSDSPSGNQGGTS